VATNAERTGVSPALNLIYHGSSRVYGFRYCPIVSEISTFMALRNKAEDGQYDVDRQWGLIASR
jgi:hypothetical protein